jgi:hypothetical protein
MSRQEDSLARKQFAVRRRTPRSAVANHLAGSFCGVPVTGPAGVENPPEFRLGPASQVGDFMLGPRGFSPKHEVADDRSSRAVAESDNDCGGEAGRVVEQGALGVEVVGVAAEPFVDASETAVRPARLGVVGGRGPECEAFGVRRLLEDRSCRLVPGATARSSTKTAPMSRSPVSTPCSWAWSVAGRVRRVVPSFSWSRSRSPSHLDQCWSRRPRDADRVAGGCGVHDNAPACCTEAGAATVSA